MLLDVKVMLRQVLLNLLNPNQCPATGVTLELHGLFLHLLALVDLNVCFVVLSVSVNLLTNFTHKLLRGPLLVRNYGLLPGTRTLMMIFENFNNFVTASWTRERSQ